MVEQYLLLFCIPFYFLISILAYLCNVVDSLLFITQKMFYLYTSFEFFILNHKDA